jgi:hypothetical protein
LLVIAGFLIVWLCLDVCGFRPLLARGRHGAGSRRSGARRSLPRCVNQCSLSGPRLRTGEPLTSPLPWCCPYWDDSSSAVSLPLPLVGAMKRPQPMTSVEPGRATLPGVRGSRLLVQGRSFRLRDWIHPDRCPNRRIVSGRGLPNERRAHRRAVSWRRGSRRFRHQHAYHHANARCGP